MKTQSPKISVLTCCYNAEDFIEEAVESILSQSYRDFEYVVVDDGSRDATRELLQRCAARDARMVFIDTEHSGVGQTVASNVGLAQTRGEWIARLDADDVALPDRLQRQINFVEAHPDVTLLGGGCIEMDQENTEIKTHSYPQTHAALLKRLEHGSAFFHHSSAFFRRSEAMAVGGYNCKFPRSLDKDLYFRLAERSRMACLPYPVVKVRKHARMISNTNHGQLQMVYGACATICHYRRQAGLFDPSNMEESAWQVFVQWVKRQLEHEGVFEQSSQWRALRAQWYRRAGRSIPGILQNVVGQVCRNPQALKAFWRHSAHNAVFLRLAEESKRLL